MAGNGRPANVQVEGIVEAVNDNGLKLDGDWVNVSKYKPVALPDVGAHVKLDVDPRGYIQKVEVLDSAPTTSTDRGRTITRLSVLKSAAQYAAYRPMIKSDDVLTIAERWLAWVDQS